MIVTTVDDKFDAGEDDESDHEGNGEEEGLAQIVKCRVTKAKEDLIDVHCLITFNFSLLLESFLIDLANFTDNLGFLLHPKSQNYSF